MVYSPPYYQNSAKYFLEKAKTQKISTSLAEIEKPDMVVFLQESAFNPQLFDINSARIPTYSIFTQDNSSLMRVQTFGGGTWLSEFSILTGLNR